jgi:predicted HicB family RNase H-like nuclease
MASDGEVWVQLATRIPKNLHRELKLHCVKSDVSVMDFVVKALREKLGREGGGSTASERRKVARG